MSTPTESEPSGTVSSLPEVTGQPGETTAQGPAQASPRAAESTGGRPPRGGGNTQSPSPGGGSVPPPEPATGQTQPGSAASADAQLRAAARASFNQILTARRNKDRAGSDPAAVSRAGLAYVDETFKALQQFRAAITALLNGGQLSSRAEALGQRELQILEREFNSARQRYEAYTGSKGPTATRGPQGSQSTGIPEQAQTQTAQTVPHPWSGDPAANSNNPFTQVAQTVGPQLFGPKPPLVNQQAQNAAAPEQAPVPAGPDLPQQAPPQGPTVAELQTQMEEMREYLERLEDQQRWNPGNDGAAGGVPRRGIVAGTVAAAVGGANVAGKLGVGVYKLGEGAADGLGLGELMGAFKGGGGGRSM